MENCKTCKYCVELPVNVHENANGSGDEYEFMCFFPYTRLNINERIDLYRGVKCLPYLMVFITKKAIHEYGCRLYSPKNSGIVKE